MFQKVKCIGYFNVLYHFSGSQAVFKMEKFAFFSGFLVITTLLLMKIFGNIHEDIYYNNFQVKQGTLAKLI